MVHPDYMTDAERMAEIRARHESDAQWLESRDGDLALQMLADRAFLLSREARLVEALKRLLIFFPLPSWFVDQKTTPEDADIARARALTGTTEGT